MSSSGAPYRGVACPGPVAGLALTIALASSAYASSTVPNEIVQPGTQPGEVATFVTPDNCDNCHQNITQPINNGQEKEREPGFGWRGGMMANAGRDALFWATVAVAEQDFLPGLDPAERGGAGDLCIRCHSVGGWIAGRSTPTDGSGLSTSSDTDGVECEFCHLLVNPDPAVNVAGTTEVQNPPFEAYDPVTGEAHRGSGQYVLNGGGTRLGPYTDINPPHAVFPSPFHRQGEMCGTCHDVSNAAVGDLAPGNGTQGLPLPPGSFSGVLGSPIQGKAAFNNVPYRYGMVERTSSEWTASALDTWRLRDYAMLPAELRVVGGALDVAYHRAQDQAGNVNRPDYADGTVRHFTCQTCHMAAATGKGCNKNGVPTRYDLPRHDQTGGSYWMPDVILYQDARGQLRLGGGLSQIQRDAIEAGEQRARAMLASAASVSATQEGALLKVRVTNLTGHKLATGYPEGRRLWLNVRWLDAGGQLVGESGRYGPIGRTVLDNAGVPHPVESLVDLAGTVVYEAKPGMSQAWAASLMALGYDSGLPLAYDRMTDDPELTLGQLAAEPAGSSAHTFHFVLNDVMTSDDRIPPYGFARDVAGPRNALPVPASLYGNPGPGGTYQHWDERAFVVPAAATRAEVRLHYQQTSWEYIQFLWRANDRRNAFLGDEGVNLLDAWLNTGMSPPFQVALASAAVAAPAGPGEASKPGAPPLRGTWNAASGRVDVTFASACDASDHALYWGDLASVGSYPYAGALCGAGTSGSASFDPGAGSSFFLMVGSNGAVEGSYGRTSSGAERPEAAGFAGCDIPQVLSATCN